MRMDVASRWRPEFPVTARCTYFDHAGVAPISARVAAAIEHFAHEARDHARLHYGPWERRAEDVRAAAARLLGAAADEIAFVASTSDGLSTIAAGLDWRRGDSVVTVDGEFPANVYPWLGLERFGVGTRVAPLVDGRLAPDAIAALIDDTTRVVSVSAVDFGSGQRRPLGAIGEMCRRAGVLFCVDGIQAVGAVEVDVERDGIDCLAADGHKWLCAPEGCGVLYVSRRWTDRLWPQRLGWKSVVDPGRFLPYHFELKPDASRFEPGSLNFLAIYALGAAIDLLLEVGMPTVEEAVLGLTDHLREQLRRAGHAILSPGGDERAGITTAQVRHAPQRVVDRLRAAGVLAAPRGGGVRFSPHFYCTDDDIARCLAALAEADRA